MGPTYYQSDYREYMATMSKLINTTYLVVSRPHCMRAQYSYKIGLAVQKFDFCRGDYYSVAYHLG